PRGGSFHQVNWTLLKPRSRVRRLFHRIPRRSSGLKNTTRFPKAAEMLSAPRDVSAFLCLPATNAIPCRSLSAAIGPSSPDVDLMEAGGTPCGGRRAQLRESSDGVCAERRGEAHFPYEVSRLCDIGTEDPIGKQITGDEHVCARERHDQNRFQYGVSVR